MAKNPKIDWRLFALAMLVAFSVRASVLVVMGSSLADDPDAYRQIALDWSRSGTFGLDGVPSAYRPPLYPTILRLLGGQTVAIGVFHLVAGLVTVAGTFLLCARVGLARWAFMAAMLVTFDPILLNQSTQVMTETTATMLVVLVILGLEHLGERPTLSRATLVGVLFGLAVLCRPEFLAWGVLCLAAIPWVISSNAGTNLAAKLTLVTFFALVVTLSPWIIRNGMVFGRPIPTTTHGGYTFLLANNGPFYEYLRSGEWGSTWDADELGPRWAGHAKFSSPAEELQADRDAYREAWSHIRHEPGMFFYSCLVRAGRLWGLTPHQGPNMVRYAVGLWYLTFFILVLLGTGKIVISWHKKGFWCRTGQTVWLWGAILIVSTTAIHILFWSNMRMRAPLVPILALVAVMGLASMLPHRQENPSSKRTV